MRRILLFLLLLACAASAAQTAQAYPGGTKLGWATIRIPGSTTPALRVNLIEGVGERELAAGLGHWPETSLPGRGERVVFSGHRTTHLHPMYDLDIWPKGSVLRLYTDMPGAGKHAYCYRLASRKIVREGDTADAYRYRPGEVVLTYACTPKHSRSHRIIGFWWRINCADV